MTSLKYPLIVNLSKGNKFSNLPYRQHYLPIRVFWIPRVHSALSDHFQCPPNILFSPRVVGVSHCWHCAEKERNTVSGFFPITSTSQGWHLPLGQHFPNQWFVPWPYSILGAAYHFPCSRNRLPFVASQCHCCSCVSVENRNKKCNLQNHCR